ncbi:platelet glycoprotein 4-like [Oppia nitens]|uniref:platelet glycoprotein 4-like n=1 Tax=Oppia nitens TaxID=1686743 RepID=UPI0023DC807E|nr:platelet glycoprotein 4-like [Oppia nitens]
MLHKSQIVRNNILLYGLIGGIITVTSGLLVILYPTLLRTVIKSQMQITEDENAVTKTWMDVPLPMYFSVYLFTIDNPRQFIRGAKAKIREMGPYVYKKHQWKEIISWSPDHESVKYWSKSSYTFDIERTVGSRNDQIIIVNVPIYVLAAIIKGLIDKLPLSTLTAPAAFRIINRLFMNHSERIVKRLTVGQLIEGYRLSILDTIDTVVKPLKLLGINIPDFGMPNNRFGILNGKNNSKSGPYEVLTGQGDTQFLKVISYENKRRFNYYDKRKCNMFNGTDGSNMGSFLHKEDTLYVFNAAACRSIYATYSGVSHVNGIPSWRYVLPANLFGSPQKNPDNRCYCRTPHIPDACDGIFYVGQCLSGAPLALSYPHLMYASRRLTQTIDGLHPNRELHESYFDIEPTLGTPMKGAARLQMNLLMQPIDLLDDFKYIREAVIPFVWFEESTQIEGNFIWLMRLAVYSMMTIEYGSVISFCLGLLVLCFTIGYTFKHWKYLTPGTSDDQSNKENKHKFADNLRDYYGTQTTPIADIRAKDAVNFKLQRMHFSPPGSID